MFGQTTVQVFGTGTTQTARVIATGLPTNSLQVAWTMFGTQLYRAT